MSKFIYRELKTRDGEREYTHKAVHELDDNVNVDEWLAEYLKDFWGEGNLSIDENGDHWFFGEIITKVHNWYFIDEDDYEVLNKFYNLLGFLLNNLVVSNKFLIFVVNKKFN